MDISVSICVNGNHTVRYVYFMHYSRARSLSLDGRYHSPSGEAAGCELHANALGMTADCFIDGL